MLPNSEIYYSERYGPGESFKYNIPVPADGYYTLILKFSEIYFQSPGEKIFDIKVGGFSLAKRLDIFGILLSKLLPLDLFFSIQVTNGKLFIENEEV